MRDNGRSRGRLDGLLGASLGALLLVALAIFVLGGGEQGRQQRRRSAPGSHRPK
jgi:hypothetical protein